MSRNPLYIRMNGKRAVIIPKYLTLIDEDENITLDSGVNESDIGELK